MFVAVQPPTSALEHLAEFLEPRHEVDSELSWTGAEQWHLTLAFLPRVLDRQLDDLTDRLARVAARARPFRLSLGGGGAFPHAMGARVLWMDVHQGGQGDAGPLGPLGPLATGARAAATTSGIEVDGARFRAHLTVARMRRPIEATRWLRVLDAYAGPPWEVDELALVESHLGEGPHRRARHEVQDVFVLGTA